MSERRRINEDRDGVIGDEKVWVVKYPQPEEEDIIEVYRNAEVAEQAREEIIERAKRPRDVTLHERKVWSR